MNSLIYFSFMILNLVISLLVCTFISLIYPRLRAESFSKAYQEKIEKINKKKEKIKQNNEEVNLIDSQNDEKEIEEIEKSTGNSLFNYYTLFFVLSSLINVFVFKKSFVFALITNVIILLFSLYISNKLRIIGITGQVASGKSYLSKYLSEKYKFVVLDIDTLNKEVLTYPSVIKEIKRIFGDDIVDENNDLKKSKIREIIYSDETKKKQLTSLTHFKVFLLLFKNIIYYKFIKGEQFVFVENAILLKLPMLMKITFPIISVICKNESTNLIRIMKRDNCNEESAKKILSNQSSLMDFITKSDYLLENNSTLDEFNLKIDNMVNTFILKKNS